MEVTNRASANKINVISEENQNTVVTTFQHNAAMTQNPTKQAEQMKGATDTQNLHNILEAQQQTNQKLDQLVEVVKNQQA